MPHDAERTMLSDLAAAAAEGDSSSLGALSALLEHVPTRPAEAPPQVYSGLQALMGASMADTRNWESREGLHYLTRDAFADIEFLMEVSSGALPSLQFLVHSSANTVPENTAADAAQGQAPPPEVSVISPAQEADARPPPEQPAKKKPSLTAEQLQALEEERLELEQEEKRRQRRVYGIVTRAEKELRGRIARDALAARRSLERQQALALPVAEEPDEQLMLREGSGRCRVRRTREAVVSNLSFQRQRSLPSPRASRRYRGFLRKAAAAFDLEEDADRRHIAFSETATRTDAASRLHKLRMREREAEESRPLKEMAAEAAALPRAKQQWRCRERLLRFEWQGRGSLGEEEAVIRGRIRAKRPRCP
eukprot:TRINITY_DN24798_c0_g2_i1.p1 TRINITY_DN24798_c0_g2~~TRINITY_DN24798_c0_g2_i1.p1  ORF type:complete len:365 (+),score=96.31 TRINITY_DN24798_c0_g2_i1:80-1174(+)